MNPLSRLSHLAAMLVSRQCSGCGRFFVARADFGPNCPRCARDARDARDIRQEPPSYCVA